MRIALINENSQAAKNEMIHGVLEKVATKYNHTVVNYGMYGADDKHQLTYVKIGLLSALLLNCGVVDFVVTGCGTGEGAMLACNSFSGVLCGHIVDPSDGYMFRQINDGNAISLAFAKGFGWGAELNLEQIFEQTFSCEGGGGYPKERVVPEKQNKLILDQVKKVTHTDIMYVLKNIEQDFLKQTINYDFFKKDFFEHCNNKDVAKYLTKVLKK